jgi:putative hydrolase of the HAD superfamily
MRKASLRPPEAVLLDVGGIFHLPSHDHVLGACSRGGFEAEAALLDRAHYRGTTAFHTNYTGELPWNEMWSRYLELYVDELGAPTDVHADVVEHLQQEFAAGGLWSRIIPGSVADLRVLAATGVRLGVVSNAEGTVAVQLREAEVLQVGPGIGVQVDCVIDSGEVGVLKPDPRIFAIALTALALQPEQVWYVGDMPGIDVVGARAAGIHPLVIDPFGFHGGHDYETVTSLRDVAKRLEAR